MLTFLLSSTLLNIPGGNLSKHGLFSVYQTSRGGNYFSAIFNINRRDLYARLGRAAGWTFPVMSIINYHHHQDWTLMNSGEISGYHSVSWIPPSWQKLYFSPEPPCCTTHSNSPWPTQGGHSTLSCCRNILLSRSPLVALKLVEMEVAKCLQRYRSCKWYDKW